VAVGAVVGLLALAAAGFVAYRLLLVPPAEPPVAKLPQTQAKPPPVAPPAVAPPKGEPPPPAEKKQEKPPPDPVPPPADAKETQALADLLLQRVNTYRKTAGVDLVHIDGELNRGCAAHARYLALNPPTGAARLLDEVPGKPGYSEDGRRAAGFALIAIGDAQRAVDQWMARPNMRVPLLNPDLGGIGVGLASLPGRTWAVVVDVARGIGGGERIVLYPAPEQQDAPVMFAGGPDMPNTNTATGFPVTILFPPLRKVSEVKAQLLDHAGKPVQASLFTPEKPATDKGPRNTAALIPNAPLRGNRVYRVQAAAQVEGKPWSQTWTFTTEDDADSKSIWALQALDKLNAIRKLAGLTPVALDPQLSRHCLAHAHYLAMNQGHPATAGLGAHDEDLSLPGATEEGRKAGKASNIAIGDYVPLHGIDSWMATLYHRVPMLEPNLRTVGWACVRSGKHGWVTVLNVHAGRERGDRPHPVFYPAPDQSGVPLHFPIFGEEPNPIPADKTGRAGYPITAFFPHMMPLLSASAILTDSAGKEVPVWFSSAEEPANAKFVKNQGNTVCLIPKEPLRPKATYQVLLRGRRGEDGWQKSWQFTTGTAGPTPAKAAARTLERLNAARTAAGLSVMTADPLLSRGCQAHAEYLVRNAALINAKKIGTNDEDPKLSGFTAEGKQSAHQSYILSRAPDPQALADEIMGSVSWRAYLLDPRLRRLGLGFSNDLGRGWRCVLDPFGGRGGDQVVRYPAPDQEAVPCAGVERAPGQTTVLGYPISVTFPPQVKLLGGNGTLTDAEGTTIETILSTPEQPLDPAQPPRSTVCLYPRTPLRSAQTYQVTLSAVTNGKQWRQSWQFTTE
jgi:uncharacterized protein YkwD